MVMICVIVIIALVDPHITLGQAVEGADELHPFQPALEWHDLTKLTKPADSVLAQHIDQSIALLASPDYQVRVDATNTLIEVGTETFARLSEAYRNTDDFEVRTRIAQIARELFLDHYVFHHYAFLGIQQQPRSDLDPMAIEILRVIPGTAAQRVGLQAGDLIIGLDGQFFTNANQVNSYAFGQTIRSHGTGGRLSLMVLRGGETYEVIATLGRPPQYIVEQDGIPGICDAYRRGLNQFDMLWKIHFESTAAMSKAGADRNKIQNIP